MIQEAIELRDQTFRDIQRVGYLFMVGAICSECYIMAKTNLHNQLTRVNNDIVLWEIEFGCVVI